MIFFYKHERLHKMEKNLNLFLMKIARLHRMSLPQYHLPSGGRGSVDYKPISEDLSNQDYPMNDQMCSYSMTKYKYMYMP